MRAISTTLLEAARSWRGVPSVALQLRDRRVRWQVHRADAGAAYPCDSVADGNAILRVVNHAGIIQTARVSEPQNLPDWVLWTTCASADVDSVSDVAIANLGAGRSRLFYTTLGGALACRESADGGLTWPAAATVATPGGLAPTLAASHEAVFWSDRNAPVRVWLEPWGGSAWTAGTAWTALGSPQQVFGVGAAWNPVSGRYHVLCAADGGLFRGTYDPTTDAWSAPVRLYPGSAGHSPSSASVRLPRVLWVDGVYWCTWREQIDPLHYSHTQALALSSTDWEHFGGEVAVQILGGPACGRAAVAYAAAQDAIYLADERSSVWAAAHPAAADLDLHVTAYRRNTSASGSLLEVEAYGALEGAAPQSPLLSEVILSRGYRTAAGHERVALDPHYLIETRIRTGLGAGDRLVLRALDGWGLLARWRSGVTLTFAGQSVRWLLAEFCARAGLAYCDDGSSGLSYQVPTFQVQPYQSAASAVRALLALAGAVARFDAAGALYATLLPAPAADPCVELGQAGEVRRATAGRVLYSATAWSVVGDAAGAGVELADCSMEIGVRLRAGLEERRLNTSAQAALYRDYCATMARLEARGHTLELPLRPDLELWDWARPYEAGASQPSGGPGRAQSLRERYDAARSLYESTVELGGTEI
ncbi:MAG: hypothetical protein ACYC4R_17030 [Anaerolineae bacterium]